jgi:hypothetical protein
MARSKRKRSAKPPKPRWQQGARGYVIIEGELKVVYPATQSGIALVNQYVDAMQDGLLSGDYSAFTALHDQPIIVRTEHGTMKIRLDARLSSLEQALESEDLTPDMIPHLGIS